MEKNFNTKTKTKKRQAGFTLIELLVVIAIIGILAGVVLAAVNKAREQGRVASVQQTLDSARGQAELYRNMYGTFAVGSTNHVCKNDTAAGGINDMLVSAGQSAGVTTITFAATSANNRVTCNVDSDAWAASVPLNNIGVSNKFWCVDSAGYSGRGGMSSSTQTYCTPSA